MINMVLTIFMLDQSNSFFIQRGKNSDIVSGNPEYCSGSTFCQCINSTFLDFDSKLNCGNQLTACRLLIEGRTAGIYTAFGMSSYNLILTTDTNDPVCNTEPIPVPIFVQDYQNIMVWNPVYNTLLQRGFTASIKDLSKVELKIKYHLQGLLLKVFINCDNKEQCIAVKFEGIQEYPLNPDLFSNYLGAYSTSASTSVISRTSEITSLKVLTTTSSMKLTTIIVPISLSPYNTTFQTLTASSYDKTLQITNILSLYNNAFQTINVSSYNTSFQTINASPYNTTTTSINASPYNTTFQTINASPYNTTIESINASSYNTTFQTINASPYNTTIESINASSYNTTFQTINVSSYNNTKFLTINVFSPFYNTIQTINASSTVFTIENSITSSIQNINQSKSVSSIDIASPVIILTPSNFVQLYSTDSFITPLIQTAMLTYSQVTKESTIEFKITNQYLATLVTISSNVYVENTTILPPQSDALISKTYAAQIIIGVSAVLLLLVFLFACFLAYKRKRRKSQFKIPKTFDTGLTSLTDVSLNNHAAMIRMENNSLSTSASMMNNAHLKSNPLYHDYFEQESLNGLEDIPIDEQITSKSLDESFILEKNYYHKKDTKVNNRRLSVIFSASQSLESAVPKDDEQSSDNDFPFSFSIERGSTPIVNKI
ncbi:uncharacterized protein LOC105849434 isoform X1 [Hydra vulgaris]|uniref:Uncharacterized protein LOC105849434 isoform X1 n=1 Tax=Hydra vulgaris TaxID=6087 RepID=A0ABM4DG75_HYDVU